MTIQALTEICPASPSVTRPTTAAMVPRAESSDTTADGDAVASSSPPDVCASCSSTETSPGTEAATDTQGDR